MEPEFHYQIHNNLPTLHIMTHITPFQIPQTKFLTSPCWAPGQYLWDLGVDNEAWKLSSPWVLRFPLSAPFHHFPIILENDSVFKQHTSSLRSVLILFSIYAYVFCVVSSIPFPTKFLYASLIFPIRATCPTHHPNKNCWRVVIINY
jgi:hypothetical protein